MLRIIGATVGLYTLITALASPLYAQTAPAPQAKLHWQALADLYYAWDFNQPADGQRAYTTQPLRHHEFALNLGLLELNYTDQQIRTQLGLQTGTYVQANLAAEPPLLQPIYAASAGLRLAEPLWLDLGIFPSHLGFESIVSADNWTLSRSLVADYSPYYESGLKLSMQQDSLTATLLMLNGWQNIQDNNREKAVGTQLNWQPDPTLLLNWSTFAGNEIPGGQKPRWRLFNDLYVVWKPLAQLEVMGLWDQGFQQGDNSGWDLWWGSSLQARWHWNDQWRSTARLEYFYDPKQVVVTTKTAQGFQTAGASLNLDYALNSHALWRLEARVLSSRDAIYPGASPDVLHPVNVSLMSSLTVRLGE